MFAEKIMGWEKAQEGSELLSWPGSLVLFCVCDHHPKVSLTGPPPSVPGRLHSAGEPDDC